MSKLSVFLRDVGLGGIVNAFDGVENNVKQAVVNSPQVQQMETQTVEQVGTAAQQVVVGAIGKAAPGATSLAAEVTTPLFAALEAFVIHFIQEERDIERSQGSPAALTMDAEQQLRAKALEIAVSQEGPEPRARRVRPRRLLLRLHPRRSRCGRGDGQAGGGRLMRCLEESCACAFRVRKRRNDGCD